MIETRAGDIKQHIDSSFFVCFFEKSSNYQLVFLNEKLEESFAKKHIAKSLHDLTNSFFYLIFDYHFRASLLCMCVRVFADRKSKLILAMINFFSFESTSLISQFRSEDIYLFSKQQLIK
jgi:hypothetical protein